MFIKNIDIMHNDVISIIYLQVFEITCIKKFFLLYFFGGWGCRRLNEQFGFADLTIN